MKNILFIIPLLLLGACTKKVTDATGSSKKSGKLSAAFTLNDQNLYAPAAIAFVNESQNAESYEWDFGDGKKTNEMNPTHEYKSSGNYKITLKAMAKGKEKKMEKIIQVKAPLECTVEIETAYGNMVAILYNATPQHRDNFIKLAEQGYYDDLLFHRVISGFMIQGGDPNSRNAKPDQNLGGGGPNYQIPAEFVDSLVHVKGALAAARTGDAVNPEKKSSGSQFYIVQGRPVPEKQLNDIEARKNFHYTPQERADYINIGGTPFLDKDYTVFGRITKGLDVIDKIAAVATNPGDRPKEDIKMKIRVVK